MTERKEEGIWGREKARSLYGSAGMVSANRAPAFKNAGSEMTHKYPDTAREPTLKCQDSPHDSLVSNEGGASRCGPVKKEG